MRKIILCNITMRENTMPQVYVSEDRSVAASSREVIYPVTAYIEENLAAEKLEVILLAKQDKSGNYLANIEKCRNEILSVCRDASFVVIESPFEEDRNTHEKLLLDIMEQLEENDYIISDITYGPKDVPIIVFTALNMAQKYLNCEIGNIIYGKGHFDKNELKGAELCDMAPLYYLNSLANTIQCDSPENAKLLIKAILGI